MATRRKRKVLLKQEFESLQTNPLDGVTVSRTKNIISDVIDGVEFELKSDFSTSASISALWRSLHSSGLT